MQPPVSRSEARKGFHDGMTLARGGLSFIYGPWDIDPVQFAWQAVARRVASGRVATIHEMTQARARLSRSILIDAADDIAHVDMSTSIRSVAHQFTSRRALIAILLSHASPGGMIFLPRWDLLDHLGMNTPNDIAAMASMARYSETSVVIASGYREGEDLASDDVREAWLDHSSELLQLVPGDQHDSRLQVVDYERQAHGTAERGTFWLERHTGYFRNTVVDNQPGVFGDMDGHDGRVTRVRFG